MYHKTLRTLYSENKARNCIVYLEHNAVECKSKQNWFECDQVNLEANRGLTICHNSSFRNPAIACIVLHCTVFRINTKWKTCLSFCLFVPFLLFFQCFAFFLGCYCMLETCVWSTLADAFDPSRMWPSPIYYTQLALIQCGTRQNLL